MVALHVALCAALEGCLVARSLLWLNAGLYLAFLLVLFPYLGEVP